MKLNKKNTLQKTIRIVPTLLERIEKYQSEQDKLGNTLSLSDFVQQVSVKFLNSDDESKGEIKK